MAYSFETAALYVDANILVDDCRLTSKNYCRLITRALFMATQQQKQQFNDRTFKAEWTEKL